MFFARGCVLLLPNDVLLIKRDFAGGIKSVLNLYMLLHLAGAAMRCVIVQIEPTYDKIINIERHGMPVPLM